MKYQGWLSILIFLTSMILLSGCTMFQPQFDTEGLELTADKFVQLLEELESTAEYIAAQTDAVMPTLPPIATFEPTETKRPTQPNTLTPTRTATATITPVYSSVILRLGDPPSCWTYTAYYWSRSRSKLLGSSGSWQI